MIGDNPIVIAIVVLGVLAYLYTKLARYRDPRRCPQCHRLVIDIRATGPEVTCGNCGTELRRSPDGVLTRRDPIGR